jgi:hypothetical protein
LWYFESAWKSAVHIHWPLLYSPKFKKGCYKGSKSPRKLNQNIGIKLVTLKWWTSIFEILTFRDLLFCYHNLDFSWLFHINQNITWLASQFSSLYSCVADHCQRSRVLSVSMGGWLLSGFMEWDYLILCFRKWFYFSNHILFMFYSVYVTLCY